MSRALAPLVLVVFLVSCTAKVARQLIVTANEAQDAAAQTYNDAKGKQTVAQGNCRTALIAAGKPLPAKAEEIVPTCAAIGVPVPYDPVKLQKAAGPINALYDAVRAANDERLKSQNSDISATVAADLAALFEQVVADLTDAHIPVSDKVKGAAAALKGGNP